MKDINKASDGHALTLLAACYLPGCIAAYVQLYRGTKYSLFPNWLDQWLKMRKHLGLWMLFTGGMHGCFYCLVYKVHYLSLIVQNKRYMVYYQG